MINSRDRKRIDFGSSAIKAEPMRPQKKDTLCRCCMLRYLMPSQKVQFKFRTFEDSNRQTKIIDQSIERVDGIPIQYIIHHIMCLNGMHEGPIEQAIWNLPKSDRIWFNPMYYDSNGGTVYHNQIGDILEYKHPILNTYE